MHKSFAFCAIFLAFFISTGVVAKTAKTSPKSHTKVVHLSKKVTDNFQSTETKNVATSNATITPSTQATPTTVNPKYRNYIDHTAISQNMRELLYAYASTSEGQQLFAQLTNPSLVGAGSSSIASPTAFAADWGLISAGIAYVNHWAGTHDNDGFASISVGFGDATKYAGLAVSLLVDSLGQHSDRFAQNGAIAAQLFHIFPNNFALAIGAGNLVPWGDLKDAAKSYYLVGSKIFDVSIQERTMPLTVSLGAGTGALHSIADAQEKSDRNIRPFGSAGWRIFPQLSVIGEWAAQETNVGLSIMPLVQFPIMLNVADCNVAHHDGKSSYFLASVTAGFHF
jgi:hypothetical protein